MARRRKQSRAAENDELRGILVDVAKCFEDSGPEHRKHPDVAIGKAQEIIKARAAWVYKEIDG